MKILIGYFVSTVASLSISIKYFRRFQLSRKEYIKYLKKSINLALCYSSFSGNNSIASYKRVGEIAFFSSAYDIITDCKKYKLSLKEKYFNILKSKATKNICSLTEGMYNKDFTDSFDNDGLERGEISLKIILLYVGSLEYFESICNIKELGEMMQITDDIIDYEEDKILNETNCFLSQRRNNHAQVYKKYFSTLWAVKLFENYPVMNYLIKKTIVKIDVIIADKPFYTGTFVSEKLSSSEII